MGHVAATGATYLIETLKPRPAGMLPEREFFDLDHVEVAGGIARAGALPRSMFFARRDPEGKRDLLLFLGEAQPARRGIDLCERILDVAARQGVERVVTFAAIGTRIHPAAAPRVFGTVTAPEILGELRPCGVEPLQEGRVGGLNGILLAAAAERNLPAMCLLGEIPFYAAAVPNPGASLAVLRAFARLSGTDVELGRLEELAGKSRQQLLALLEQLKAQSGQAQGEDESVFEGMETEPPAAPPPRQPALDPASRRRIEKLFSAAERDRAAAGPLKSELDRLGVFREYEERFLNLFRRGG
jgi:hypothetical protein